MENNSHKKLEGSNDFTLLNISEKSEIGENLEEEK
jgi:hypothetical protein